MSTSNTEQTPDVNQSESEEFPSSLTCLEELAGPSSSCTEAVDEVEQSESSEQTPTLKKRKRSSKKVRTTKLINVKQYLSSNLTEESLLTIKNTFESMRVMLDSVDLSNSRSRANLISKLCDFCVFTNINPIYSMGLLDTNSQAVLVRDTRMTYNVQGVMTSEYTASAGVLQIPKGIKSIIYQVDTNHADIIT